MIDAALVSYVGVMSVTPGPNNLLLAASGVHFGWRRTLPQMFGISLGGFALVVLITWLFGAVVGFFAGVRPWLAVVGGGYLLWLSWQILRSGAPEEKEGRRPMTLIESALFQLANPKAWVMVINVALFFAPAHGDAWSALVLGLVFVAVNLPCIAVWVLTGDRLRRFLATGKAALVFNAVMAGLMAITAIWLIIEEFLAAARA